ncbi:gluconate 5-dehydrogenase [Variibacter gotjawalensis]|uniref:Gluconate 5-dehydrogenase n=1 Tax=Variibacter gotjawalensis TaxID=1333996 RepID=A0A0S3PXS7_9BRAD|nr:SDR family oxidoreductase [Variibacter gotjawalensis]NIK46549.1 gluconate 5-dehydrogenase [Variibacter gotjawalensis]RZS48454.1 gluconate 5-dehydrogenase [Variibacter gotjawalensis]BAT60715.1 gluconate 5-dehydrogenase [Variibacter gotjawalensis]
MPPPFSLDGRIALITGGGQGLGLAIARGLAEAGAHVVLNGRNAERLEAAALSLRGDKLSAEALAFDATDETAVVAAIDTIARKHGRIDILVNNAGIRDRRALADTDAASTARLIEANLLGPAMVSRLALPLLQKSKAGRLINITSIAGHISRAGDASYTASKAGLTGLTKALAAEWGPLGITVNAIAPGYFATEPNRTMVEDPANAAFLAQRTSLGRWGRPEEIAGAAVFLASDAASYISGHTLAVDGGFLSHW